MKMKERLEARGFTVKMGDDDDADASKATGTDLVIVTQSTGETRIGTKYTGVPVPLICMQGLVFDDMKMTAAAGAFASVTQIAITSTSHALAAGMTGSVTVAAAAANAGYGSPPTGAEKVATIPGQANQIAIFGYPSGAMMNGMTAPAKRVGFFATEAMAAAMNESGWKLFDAAVDWALK
jgi:hypothetical protein